jgi:hypothetical protein
MALKGGTPRNLKPFKKGNDPRRNLNGAPPIYKKIKEALQDELTSEIKGKTRAQKIAKKMVELSERGNVRAAEFVFDRVEGKVLQSIAIESERPIIQLINVSKSFNQLDGFTINDSVSPDKEIKEEN